MIMQIGGGMHEEVFRAKSPPRFTAGEMASSACFPAAYAVHDLSDPEAFFFRLLWIVG